MEWFSEGACQCVNISTCVPVQGPAELLMTVLVSLPDNPIWQQYSAQPNVMMLQQLAFCLQLQTSD